MTEDVKTLKEFKREIKQVGYKYKTYKIDSFGDGGSRCLEILDQDNNYVCGAGGNVFPQEHRDKHIKAFELINQNEGKVVDENGKEVLMG